MDNQSLDMMTLQHFFSTSMHTVPSLLNNRQDNFLRATSQLFFSIESYSANLILGVCKNLSKF